MTSNHSDGTNTLPRRRKLYPVDRNIWCTSVKYFRSNKSFRVVIMRQLLFRPTHLPSYISFFPPVCNGWNCFLYTAVNMKFMWNFVLLLFRSIAPLIHCWKLHRDIQIISWQLALEWRKVGQNSNYCKSINKTVQLLIFTKLCINCFSTHLMQLHIL